MPKQVQVILQQAYMHIPLFNASIYDAYAYEHGAACGVYEVVTLIATVQLRRKGQCATKFSRQSLCMHVVMSHLVHAHLHPQRAWRLQWRSG